MEERKGTSTIVLLIAVVMALLVGGLIGWFSHQVKRRYAYDASLINAMELVRTHYVDSVDMETLAEGLIPSLLHSLDPHSEYIDRTASLAETQRLEGHFYGVGITFNTIIDTPVVVEAIKGGSASRAGIQAGDRLISADGKSLIHDSITSDEVQKQLRGERGTIVKVGVLRNGELKNIGITRDEVPIRSINVAYMLNDVTGIIKIDTWARTTLQEFLSAYYTLSQKGLKNLIIDLRDNVGGYMQSAIQLANEFLPSGSLIVYSQGRKYPKEEYFANGNGLLKEVPLAILVNEFSASSSEIFSAAMQDHDRATIIGRRTFGKGLIQHPFYMPDSSQIRLTIARYYTPSGRSIQKKYNLGKSEEYQRDLLDRYDTGEIYHADSSFYKTAPKFRTDAGRIVYGGNGIMPDIFVPADSSGQNTYYYRLIESGLIPQYAFIYSDKYRFRLNKILSTTDFWNYIHVNDNIVERFANYAAQKGIGKRPAMLWECSIMLEKILIAQVARNFFGEQGFYEIVYNDDKTIQKALESFNQLPFQQ